jgi:3'5'-cyclic nucleotide phosphodiesterase
LPNAVLVKEGTPLAKKYDNKSVAEQNSMEIAWTLFCESKYDALRECLFESDADLEHFRAVLTNAVMATDIMDKELGEARKKRWEIAFANEDCSTDSDNSGPRECVHRKATIVIEVSGVCVTALDFMTNCANDIYLIIVILAFDPVRK